MKFHAFVEIMRDWNSRLMPAQVRSWIEGIFRLVEEFPPRIELERAMAVAEDPAKYEAEIAAAAVQSSSGGVAKARRLLRQELASGPKPGAQVEAAAEAAAISKDSLFDAADALGIRTQKGQWWLPGDNRDSINAKL